MRILVVSQYFWPENFKINDLCLGLKERGHEVTVLTGKPNYPKGVFYEDYGFFKKRKEEWNGIKIYRSEIFPRGMGILRLILNYFSFIIFASFRSFFIKGQFDKVFVFEPSPITVGIPAMIIAKRKNVPYYFWVQDLWPESLTAAGGITNKFVLSVFDKITRLIYKKSEKVLVQSKGFIDYIIDQDVPSEKIIFYPNSTESFYKPELPIKEYMDKLPNSGFKIMFAGNLGEAQGLETLIDAADILKQRNFDIQWVFLGDGRQKSYILEKINEKGLENNVYLLGAYPSEQMPKFFACADALLVSLKKEKIFSITVPSKVQSYLACGRPILASLEGEGAKVIIESKSGFVSPPENSAILVENIIKLHSLSLKNRQVLGSNAIKYFKKEFERELLINRLIEILNDE